MKMFTPKKINAPLSMPPSPTKTVGCCAFKSTFRSTPRTPQEVYFESRGKCCKKLLRFNGYPNKVKKVILFYGNFGSNLIIQFDFLIKILMEFFFHS